MSIECEEQEFETTKQLEPIPDPQHQSKNAKKRSYPMKDVHEEYLVVRRFKVDEFDKYCESISENDEFLKVHNH